VRSIEFVIRVYTLFKSFINGANATTTNKIIGNKANNTIFKIATLTLEMHCGLHFQFRRAHYRSFLYLSGDPNPVKRSESEKRKSPDSQKAMISTLKYTSQPHFFFCESLCFSVR
jgi:hypothetical protein